MQLSPGQLREFDEQGYLFFPNCFNEEEIAQLRDDAEAILKLDRQEVWREKTGAPRTRSLRLSKGAMKIYERVSASSQARPPI